jgi:hypothetical protein
MLYFLYKYRIALTAMQLDSLEPVYDIYTYTDYVTQCRYLCNAVYYVKNLVRGSLVDASKFEHINLKF